MKKERLDVLVHERGLAESRTRAQALILAGQVVVDDQRVDKPGTKVPVDAELRLKGEVMPYVSRGGLKLKGALDAFVARRDGRGLRRHRRQHRRLHRLPAAGGRGAGARHRRGPRAAAREAARAIPA